VLLQGSGQRLGLVSADDDRVGAKLRAEEAAQFRRLEDGL